MRPFNRDTATVSLGLGVLGVILLMACSLVDAPYTSHRVGAVSRIQWGPGAPVPSGSVDCSCYFLEVEGYIFRLNGPVQPANAGPSDGQTVDVTYLDTSNGWTVLSLVTNPGTSQSITYTTPDYARYKQNLAFSVASQAGLVAGFALVVLAVILPIRAATTARLGAAAFALGLSCTLGLVPMIAANFALSGFALTYQLLTVAWLVAAVASLVSGVGSRARHEQPTHFAAYGLLSSIGISLLVIAGWAAFAIRALSS